MSQSLISACKHVQEKTRSSGLPLFSPFRPHFVIKLRKWKAYLSGNVPDFSSEHARIESRQRHEHPDNGCLPLLSLCRM
jgi:hypothetical protein